MSNEQQQKEQPQSSEASESGAPSQAPVLRQGSRTAEADLLFNASALFLQAVAQGSVQQAELYAPTLNRLSERAQQLLRHCSDVQTPNDQQPPLLLLPHLESLQASLLPSVPAANTVEVRITCIRPRVSILYNYSTCLTLLHAHVSRGKIL